MSDPGRRRTAFVRSLRVRVSVAVQQGNERAHVLAQEGGVGGHARGGDGLVAVRGRPQAPP